MEAAIALSLVIFGIGAGEIDGYGKGREAQWANSARAIDFRYACASSRGEAIYLLGTQRGESTQIGMARISGTGTMTMDQYDGKVSADRVDPNYLWFHVRGRAYFKINSADPANSTLYLTNSVFLPGPSGDSHSSPLTCYDRTELKQLAARLSPGRSHCFDGESNREDANAFGSTGLRAFFHVNTATATPVQIKACNDGSVDLRSAAVGFKCRTSKGAIFERVARQGFGEAWKGPDGLVWSDFVGKYSQYDAIMACKKLNGTLPSRADFERAEAKGFREILPNMKKWFWSSSAHPTYDFAASVFSSKHGIIDGVSRYGIGSVRCVGQ